MYIELTSNESSGTIRSKKQIIFNRMMKVKMRVNKGTLEHSFIQHFFFSIYYSEILSFALEIQQKKGNVPRCQNLYLGGEVKYK